jgi:hypothetical protein
MIRCVLALAVLLIALALAGCSDVGAPTSQPVVDTPVSPAAEAVPIGPETVDAALAHGLTAEMQPIDPSVEFAPEEAVHISLRLPGHPREGVVKAFFQWRDEPLAESSVDLSDPNTGFIAVSGEDTYVGFVLEHDEPLPISDQYLVILLLDDTFLGASKMTVIPPSDALPSVVTSVELAPAVDADQNPVDPTATFMSDQRVFLVGRADLGVGTWLQAEWYVGEGRDDTGTRSLTIHENGRDAGFNFSFLPQGGWPPGEHAVVLIMNDKEVGRYSFQVEGVVRIILDALPANERDFWSTFPLPDDAAGTPVIDLYDLGFYTSMVEPELFDYYAGWLKAQGWQQQAPTEAMITQPHQVWRRDQEEFLIEIVGMDDEGRTLVWFQYTPAED